MISKKLPMVWFLAIFLLVNCNKNNDGDGISVADRGKCFASYKIGNQNFEFDDLALCVFFENTLNLGSSFTGGDFQLQVNPISGPGNYVADSNNTDLFVVVVLIDANDTRLVSNDLTVNVTEVNNDKAKGTFQGTFFAIDDTSFSNPITVTDGAFEANF